MKLWIFSSIWNNIKHYLDKFTTNQTKKANPALPSPSIEK
jgi:hypothetical protein